jgi:GST-like protein
VIDLYYWPTGNGLKIGILLEELELELELEYRLLPVNIRAGEQKQTAFQRISANGSDGCQLT